MHGDAVPALPPEQMAQEPVRLSLNLIDLARDAVSVAAPAQLELFDEATDRWRAGRGPGRVAGWQGGTVGSGVIATLTSDVVYPVLVAAIAQVCGSAAVAGWRRRWWRPRRPIPTPEVSIVLDEARLRAFRSACVAHAVRMGLSRSEAQVLADAVVGALHRATLTAGSTETRAD